MDSPNKRFKIVNPIQHNTASERKYKRKIAAIMSADVKGYSKLMGRDEERTVTTITAYRQVFYKKVSEHSGRVVDSPGDNILSEFENAIDAVKCAQAIQAEIKERNKKLDKKQRMQFRIGINYGDVIEDQGRLYGDGINIAARLESIAEGGGICFSGTIYDQIKDNTVFNFSFLGTLPVKNIKRPVRTYKILMNRMELFFKREYKAIAYLLCLITSVFLLYHIHLRFFVADNLFFPFLALNPAVLIKSYFYFAIPPALIIIGFIAYVLLKKGVEKRVLKILRAFCWGGITILLGSYAASEIPDSSQLGLQNTLYTTGHKFIYVDENSANLYAKRDVNSQILHELEAGDVLMFSDIRQTLLNNWNSVYNNDSESSWISKSNKAGIKAISLKNYSFKYSDLIAVVFGLAFFIIGWKRKVI